MNRADDVNPIAARESSGEPFALARCAGLAARSILKRWLFIGPWGNLG